VVKDADGDIFYRLPESDGVNPFINDREAVRCILSDLANGDDRAVGKTKALVSNHINRTHAALVIFQWKGDALRRVVQPKLTGVESCIYYAIALLFHYDLKHRVKACEAKDCGRFFVSQLFDRVKGGCSREHAAIVKRQHENEQAKIHRIMVKRGRPNTKPEQARIIRANIGEIYRQALKYDGQFKAQDLLDEKYDFALPVTGLIVEKAKAGVPQEEVFSTLTVKQKILLLKVSFEEEKKAERREKTAAIKKTTSPRSNHV
jgi:hypothetical protein